MNASGRRLGQVQSREDLVIRVSCALGQFDA
jgi:hypothetical protein